MNATSICLLLNIQIFKSKMNEVFTLILESMIVSMINYVVFSLVFKRDFDLRFNRYQGRVKNLMARENRRFVETMKGIIELDPDVVEKTGFGESWRYMVSSLNKVKKDKSRFEHMIQSVYYPVIGSVFVSASALMVPYGISLPMGYRLYLTSVGWVLLLFSLILLGNLVFLYRSLEKKISGLPMFPEDILVPHEAAENALHDFTDDSTHMVEAD
jgi:hypothetical protein